MAVGSESGPDAARVAVIGGGPAGLMAAEVLAGAGKRVTVYDRMPSLGRKLLLAGRGGLNLTHSEDLARFMPRYGRAALHLRAAIDAFTPQQLRQWCEDLGQETFVGSSGRVFPKAMKASPLLRAWLRRLGSQGVEVRLRYQWKGWDEGRRLLFDTPEGRVAVMADAVVLALGGASWPQLGSDGACLELVRASGIDVAPLQPANCGFLVSWSDVFRARFAGQPLKRLGLRCGVHHVRGEALVTERGLEGGGIYALAPALREEITSKGRARLDIDLRPDESVDALEKRLGGARGKQSLTNFLRKALRLSPTEIGLLQEAAVAEGKRLADLPAVELARRVKAVPLDLVGVAPIARAISTAGGIMFDGIDQRFMLRARPGVFIAGEMLDWEAPTGGYLLQACFATGAAAGRGVLDWLNGGSSGAR